MKYKSPSDECSNQCGRKRRPGQRTCRECHREYMRAHRMLAKQAKQAKPQADTAE